MGRAYADNMLLALDTSDDTPIPYMLYTALAYLLGPREHWALRRYGAIVAVVIIALMALYFIR